MFQIEIWCNFTKKGEEKSTSDTICRTYFQKISTLRRKTSNNIQITADRKQSTSLHTKRGEILKKKSAAFHNSHSQPERFELSRGNPMYLAGTRLNHSAKAAVAVRLRYLYIFIGFFSQHNPRTHPVAPIKKIRRS